MSRLPWMCRRASGDDLWRDLVDASWASRSEVLVGRIDARVGRPSTAG
ncbi:MAG: hypothetical protein Q8K58_14000 [Acidimicrobiales bacterium]|nr:hypothetical protein [Acidimicrobiales bacterium]